jgi:hypothetical protein
MQCGTLPNLRAGGPMKLHPLDISGDGFSDRELNAGLMLLDFEAMFISKLLCVLIAECDLLEIISNAERHYAITLVPYVSPR